MTAHRMWSSKKSRTVSFPRRRAFVSIATVAVLTAGIGASSLTVPIAANAAVGGDITGQIFGIIGRCLADKNNGADTGNPVVLHVCDGTPGQQWTVHPNQEITIHGRCLGPKPGAGAFTPVGLYPCTGAATQQWSQQSNSELVNSGTGLCLADRHGRTGNENPIWVDPCSAGAAQYWHLPSLADNPSGLAMPVGNVPGWRQVFTDNFTEDVPVGHFPDAVASKWTDYADGWKDTTGLGTYMPTKVVSIGGGIMNMHLHSENGVHMVAAPEPKIPGAPGRNGGLLYGRYVIRFRADPVKGYKTAWMLWPDSNLFTQGEIDFPEGDVNYHFNAYMHHRDNFFSQSAYVTHVTYTSWHTIVTDWSPTDVSFYVDGNLVGSVTNRAWIPDVPMHWVLQTESELHGGVPDWAAGNVQIDWVAIYAHV